MEKHFQKNRPRLLIICKSSAVRGDLVTLLTGYGYYVDYEEEFSEGLNSFREHKQAIVILDPLSLPKHPERMFQFFNTYRRNPVVLIAAYREEHRRLFPYLQQGVYDIVELPLNSDYLQIALRRMVEHGALLSGNEYMRTVLALVSLSTPVWLALAFIIGVLW